MQQLKQQLHALCMQQIEQRIATASEAMNMANSSANDETKSSAGDKYETTREMIQQEIDKLSAAIAEAVAQKQLLELISTQRIHDTVQSGSIVETDKNVFYISVAAGAIIIDNKKYLAISPSSPIGNKMIGLKQGDDFVFNNIKQTIISVQ
ncbi:MAG TPA: hypothetical protein PLW44_07155 [Chitinophagales bacterium]|nr:hypothetical protein [Chitinophagales bacterium]